MSTPRPDSAPAPGADQTVRLGPGTGDGEETHRPEPRAAGEARTVRLARPDRGAADLEATVRLDGAEAESATFLDPRVWGGTPAATPPSPGADASADLGAAPVPLGAADLEATVRLDGAEAESATFLDPRVWGGTPAATPPSPGADASVDRATPPSPGTDASADLGTTRPDTTRPDTTGPDTTSDERPLAPGELRRFGPGVPPQAAAAWHGEAAPDRPRPRRPRRVRRWLVPVAVLLAVLAFLFWRFHTPALAVTAVGVTTDPQGPGCAGTAVVTAAVETNGGAGTLRYRWLRSDGTTSDEIAQDVHSGMHHTDLVLRWTFEGHGSLQATATLEILSPASRTAAASFAYHCP